LQIAEGTGIGLATSGTTLDGVVTITADDPSLTNEGVLSVITGGPSTSIINSNTGGGSQVVLEAGSGITLSELANTITITASGAADGNGYYGGNGGNGGDGTIPSVTQSTLTNQLTFYRATDDAGGLVPIRIQVDAGNEPDFMSFKNLSDSLVIKRSDQDFYIRATKNLVLNSNDIVAVIADSVQITSVPDAYTQEKTFLLMSQNGTITKREVTISSITTYTTPGNTTVAVPVGAKSLEVVCVGAGGGGGSGRKGAAGSSRGGGGGGGGGSVSTGVFSVVTMGNPANITVSVGAGGTGGAFRSTNSTNGALGTAGGESNVNISGTKIIRASGGSGADGGTTAAGSFGSSGSFADYNGSNGGSGGAATPNASSNCTNRAASGGGGGAGITSGNGTAAGASSGGGYYNLVSGVGGDNDGGANGNNPASGQLTGSGGAGGGTTGAVRADGGNGGTGAGGGGGAAGIDGTHDSGAGGTGGNGIVILTWYF
jgi:hypothetical protein